MWELLLYTFLVLLHIIFMVRLWAVWNYAYWKKFNIPFVKPIPFFGNMKDLFFMKKNSGQVYTEFYWKYPEEPAVGVYKMRQPQLVIRDLDLIKTALVKEFNSFHDNMCPSEFQGDPFFSASVFTAKGDKWITLTSLHTQSQSPNKIKAIFPLMQSASKDMISHVEQNLDVPIEAKYVSGLYATDFLSSCIYGMRTNSFSDPDAEFRKMTAMFFKDGSTPSTVMIIRLIPKFAKLLNISLVSKPVRKFFIKIVKEIYEDRKKNNKTENDFLQTLFDEYMNDENPRYTLDEIAAHAITFFIDSYEAISTLMAFVLYMLALHPDVQEKLREETRNLPRIDYDTVNELKYLDAVINETLRLYPPGVVLTRECAKDITLRSSDKIYPMVEGMTIAVPLYPIFRDPKYYKEPTEFNPSRFSESATPSSFLPYGLGARACSSSKFALTQIKVALINLLLSYKIVPTDPDARMPDINPQDVVGIVPKSGLWIKFETITEYF